LTHTLSSKITPSILQTGGKVDTSIDRFLDIVSRQSVDVCPASSECRILAGARADDGRTRLPPMWGAAWHIGNLALYEAAENSVPENWPVGEVSTIRS
jgi:hypothetical protein